MPIPQMSPMSWTMISLSSMMIIMLIMSKYQFFSKEKASKKEMNMIKSKMKKWKY